MMADTPVSVRAVGNDLVRLFIMLVHDQFIDTLFALSIEPEFATAILPHFANVMGTPSSNIGVMDTRAQTYTHEVYGLDQEFLQKHGERYFPMNPWVRAGFVEEQMNPGAYAKPTVRLGSRLVPYREYEETEFYRDFNRHTGVGDDMLATFLPLDNHVVAFAASVGGRLFGEAEANLAQALLPHLSNAFRLHMRIATRSRTTGTNGFASESAAAIMTLTGNKLREANATARSLLDKGSVLRLVGQRVEFLDSVAQDAFSDMRRGNGTAIRTCIVHEGRERWLVQLVRRARARILDLLQAEDPSVCVVVSPLSAAAAIRQGAIRGFTDLTNVEQEILGHLVNGRDIPWISAHSGRSRETVRWHVGNLRRKLGARSMLDLARTAALLLPLI
jgi:DNA-binding CsgD family transcriptional regulator